MLSVNKEEFRDVPGYEGLYQVSNLGNVYSLITKKLMRPGLNSEGYLRVTLTKMGKKKCPNVHRLVAISFLGLSDLIVNHIDGNKTNNNLSNLEYVTHKENHSHAIEIGLEKGIKGTNNPKNKLTEKEVFEIRDLIKSGMYQKDIAKIYDVNQVTISYIKIGKIWGHT